MFPSSDVVCELAHTHSRRQTWEGKCVCAMPALQGA